MINSKRDIPIRVNTDSDPDLVKISTCQLPLMSDSDPEITGACGEIRVLCGAGGVI